MAPHEQAAPRGDVRLTQAARRARSRAALLEATARGLSRVGYGNLVLDAVAAEAGYTRGALYHQFDDKEALVLATLEWVRDTWYAEVGSVFGEGLPPAETLVELARRHAVYCRRGIAGVMAALRVDFRRDHPVGDAVRGQAAELVDRVRRLILAGRSDGTIPPGPPASALAAAYLAAVEGAVIALAGRVGDDEEVARRVALGVIGASAPSRGASTRGA
jgi:AcrR family transcriptional regulator